MKNPEFKKNYIARVPLYLILLLWYTGKFAIVQTYKYAPRFILVPRCHIRSIGKPWKKVKEAAYKVMKHKASIWYFKETNYDKISSLYCYFKMPGWKQLYRYTQLWNVWDHKLLYRIKERWRRRDVRNKRVPFNSSCSRRPLKDSHSHILKLIRKSTSLANRKTLKSLHYNTKFNLYRRMPWKAISRLWGQINSLELPHWLRKPAYNLYIWMFDCQLEEAVVQDLSKYRNLSEFFRRLLKPGVRPVDAKALLTSPADGRVLYCGKVKNGVLEQVKGVTYSLKGFLGPSSRKTIPPEAKENADSVSARYDTKLSPSDVPENQIFRIQQQNEINKTPFVKSGLLSDPITNRMFYCIIYLAPGDYHRFHSPANWCVQKRRHFPGELFSVKPSVAKWLKGLFNMNERVVYFGKWIHGFFSMTPVGATNVGSISIYIDKELKTNAPSRLKKGCFFDKSFIRDECRNLLGVKDVIKSLQNVNEETEDEKMTEYNCSSIEEGTDDSGELSDTLSDFSEEVKNNIPGVFLKKGKLVGEFNLGSTIVLLFEAPNTFTFSVIAGQKVKYGQALSSF